MALGKWIGGFLGFMVFGPLGALAGYALGSLFDNRILLRMPIVIVMSRTNIPVNSKLKDSATASCSRCWCFPRM